MSNGECMYRSVPAVRTKYFGFCQNLNLETVGQPHFAIFDARLSTPRRSLVTEKADAIGLYSVHNDDAAVVLVVARASSLARGAASTIHIVFCRF